MKDKTAEEVIAGTEGGMPNEPQDEIERIEWSVTWQTIASKPGRYVQVSGHHPEGYRYICGTSCQVAMDDGPDYLSATVPMNLAFRHLSILALATQKRDEFRAAAGVPLEERGAS